MSTEAREKNPEPRKISGVSWAVLSHDEQFLALAPLIAALPF
jgi:hypothetical protein